MNTDPIISIIMPVYNTEEEYLREAIKSVRRQFFRDFELIMVNDGSTNNSEDVILSIKDERFKYIKQDNAGQGKARNEGLKVAKGKYIFFLDADDWLELDALATSYEKAEKYNLDILFFNVKEFNNKLKEIFIWIYDYSKVFKNEQIYSGTSPEILKDLFFINHACWGKLFKRDFLINNNLFFYEGLIFEDLEYFYRYMLKAERICFIDNFLYNYRTQVKDSTIFNTNKKHFNLIKIFDLVEHTLIEYNLFDQLKKNFYQNKLDLLTLRYGNIAPELKDQFKALIEENLKEMKLTKTDIIDLEKERTLRTENMTKNNVSITQESKDFISNYVEFLDYLVKHSN